MLIDWFTVFAQILNFLILVALLRWVLYRPILKVMQKRLTLLNDRWQEAEQAQSVAQQEIASYRQQRQAFQEQQQTLLAEAQAAVNEEQQRQLMQIRQEMERLRATWQEELEQELKEILQRLKEQIVHQSCLLARKALSDLANADLEQQMIHVFCDRLQHLEDEQRQAIIQSLSSLSEPILVRSHFALTLEAQQALITTLKTQFAPDSAIEFVTTSDLNCGIEVKLSGQKLAWSLDSYLQTLEQELFSTLTHKGTLHNEPHF